MKKIFRAACFALSFLLCIGGGVVLSACKGNSKKGTSEKTIEKITVSSNINDFYKPTDTVDFSDISVVVSYSDKSKKTLTNGEFDKDASQVDATTEFVINTNGLYGQTPGEMEEGSYVLSVYLISEIKSYSYKTVTVTESLTNFYNLSTFDAPQFVKTYNTNVGSISDTDEGSFYSADKYMVGDDNGFVFKPQLTVLDKTTSLPVATPNHYKLDMKVEIYDDEELLQTIDKVVEGQDYSYFTYSNFEFTFGEDALGKTFRLSVLPDDFRNENNQVVDFAGNVVDAFTFSFDVADGYNVYNAIDLGRVNLVSEAFKNSSDLRGTYNRHMDEIFYNGTTREYKNNYVIWESFLQDKIDEGSIANDLAPVNGIFVHGDIDVTVDDIPADYIISADENAGAKDTLRDYSFLYNHFMENDFVLNGNFFKIDFSAIPVGVSNTSYAQYYNTSGTETTQMGHSAAFAFTGKYGYQSTQTAIFVNTNLIGNTQGTISSDDDDVVKKTSGSLIMAKSLSSKLEATNNIAKNFLIGFYSESNGTRYEEEVETNKTGVTLDHCKIYNCYTSALFSWAGDNNTITNSELKRFGGPALFLIDQITRNSQTSAITKVEQAAWIAQSTTITNEVMGGEAWFKLTGADNIATQLISLNAILKNYGKTFVTKSQGGKSYMNMIAIAMDKGYLFSSEKLLANYLLVGEQSEQNIPFSMDEKATNPVNYMLTQTGYQTPILLDNTGVAACVTASYTLQFLNGSSFAGDKLVIVYPVGNTVAVVFLDMTSIN